MPHFKGLPAPETVRLDGRLEDGEIRIMHLSEDQWQDISLEHAIYLLNAYVDPGVLRRLAARRKQDPGVVFLNLVPTGATYTGNFGEVFVYALFEDQYGADVPCVKLRLRLTANQALTGTDVIAVSMQGPTPAEDDHLYVSEVKTRSGSVKKTIVREAVNGVLADMHSRLAESLLFQEKLLEESGDSAGAERLWRFEDPVNFPYETTCMAVVLHDSDRWKDEFLNELPRRHDTGVEVVVLVVRVKCLRDWIDAVHAVAAAQADV
ncbi:MAG: SAVED domain-containing protein [Coriobacteriia bacterium]|nr:SAVED domain-containing protein [Coriobacteriia bacterium]